MPDALQTDLDSFSVFFMKGLLIVQHLLKNLFVVSFHEISFLSYFLSYFLPYFLPIRYFIRKTAPAELSFCNVYMAPNRHHMSSVSSILSSTK